MTGGRGSRVRRSRYGTTPAGDAVDIYTLTTASGMELGVISYGGIIVSIRVPDRHGALGNVTLGYTSLEGYLRDSFFTGALIGRYANRIAHGLFTIDGQDVAVATNDGEHHLHGGALGFHRRVWGVAPAADADNGALVLTLTSPAGDAGFPGRLDVRVTYTLTDRHELVVDYHAITDRPTPVNLTHHAYFNLAGEAARDILGHELTLAASAYTPVDDGLIPTGEIRPVRGTPFDFTQPRRIGERIADSDAQVLRCGGYDHNFVLDAATSPDDPWAARLHDPTSGRVLEIRTTEPGLQIYSGNHLDGGDARQGDPRFRPHGGIALEPQHFPNSPNEPSFPSTILRPGSVYTSRTMYSFHTGAPSGS
ncbi:MAG: galactose mutarotase [Gemmatimonadaceae bacterium]